MDIYDKPPSGSLNVGCVVEFSMLSVITHLYLREAMKNWLGNYFVIIKSSKKNGFVCVVCERDIPLSPR